MNDTQRERPLQALLFAPDTWNRDDIIAGRINGTIRYRHRDYSDGPAVLCCHIVEFVQMRTITEVRHCTLLQLTRNELRTAGFATTNQVIAELKKYYPDIAPDSEITFVRWQPPQR